MFGCVLDPLLLFGGGIEVLYRQRKVLMDGWMEFTIAPRTAVLLLTLRRQVSSTSPASLAPTHTLDSHGQI